MKILFIDKQEKSIGGMGNYSTQITGSLSKKGHTVIPLRFGKKLKENDPPNTILLPYLMTTENLYFIPQTKTVQLIEKTLREQKPDIIHLSLALSPLDFYIPYLAHRLGIPSVGILHSAFSENSKQSFSNIGVKSVFLTYLPCLLQLDQVLVFSQEMSDFLQRNKVKPQKISVVPNAIDTQIFSPGASHFKNKHRLQFGYLFLGRLDRQKNPDLLIRAFLQTKPPLEQKLVMVGEGTIGSLGADLKSEFANHPQIIFTGSITNLEEKIDIIRACDVFVQPSSFEGMSYALLEAMSCGLAPISTNCGNHQEVIKDSGLIIEHEKIREQLPIALQVFSKSPSLAKTFGQKAREQILKNYDLEKQSFLLISLYQRLIAEAKEKGKRASFFSQLKSLVK